MDKADFYRDAHSDLSGPLAGIRVLEATTSWAGPMCACMLADLGADVIKVEDPAGEVGRRIPPFLPGATRPISFLQATVNRNKRSLTLDLRTPQGRDIFLKLTRNADIVVQNFRPGTFDKWGVGYAACRGVKPDIIYVSVSGFGQFGPFTTESATIHLRRRCPDSCRSMGRSREAPARLPPFSAMIWRDCTVRSPRSRRCNIALAPARDSIAMCRCWTRPSFNPTVTLRRERSGH